MDVAQLHPCTPENDMHAASSLEEDSPPQHTTSLESSSSQSATSTLPAQLNRLCSFLNGKELWMPNSKPWLNVKLGAW
ncbi:hypothetical protein PIB30_001388 [Stylosanthes scabra]|uniref:Uncharacterized protein n=1 Tax=Stylosanthes scabra TaxID=79078 RepID=A0ABU6Z1F9_9FABA|nr:hypothetical protein [Stylosanthes scabra]